MKKNDLLEPENFFEGYQDSIDSLKNNKESIMLDKLQYLVFNSKEGKMLLDEYMKRFVIPGFTNPNTDHAATSALYFDGFKQAYRLIFDGIRSHEQRIEAEAKK